VPQFTVVQYKSVPEKLAEYLVQQTPEVPDTVEQYKFPLNVCALKESAPLTTATTAVAVSMIFIFFILLVVVNQ